MDLTWTAAEDEFRDEARSWLEANRGQVPPLQAKGLYDRRRELRERHGHAERTTGRICRLAMKAG